MNKIITCTACGDFFPVSYFLPGKNVCINCEFSNEEKARQRRDRNFRHIDNYQLNPNSGTCRTCDD